jgi:phosphoribosylglycinamide formyltransferase 1
MTPSRVAVLASGGGSNAEAIIAHLALHGDASVVLAVTNRAGAGVLARAQARDTATHVLANPDDAHELLQVLHAHDVGTVALAGYLRFVPPDATRAFAGRMVNVHPSLLPAFGGHGMYGRHVHAAVLAAGVRVTGATVHFVDEVYDRGPIVAQWPVPVAPDDTAETLAARVLRAEHALFPRAVRALATGRVSLGADGRVHGVPALAADAAFHLGSGAAVPPHFP